MNAREVLFVVGVSLAAGAYMGARHQESVGERKHREWLVGSRQLGDLYLRPHEQIVWKTKRGQFVVTALYEELPR